MIRTATNTAPQRLTLPGRRHDPGLAAIGERGVCGDRLALLGKEAVDHRSRPRDVGPKGPERAKFLRERRRGQVVGRECRQVAERECSEKLGTPVGKALAGGEGVVDGPRRRLALAAWQ